MGQKPRLPIIFPWDVIITPHSGGCPRVSLWVLQLSEHSLIRGVSGQSPLISALVPLFTGDSLGLPSPPHPPSFTKESTFSVNFKCRIQPHSSPSYLNWGAGEGNQVGSGNTAVPISVSPAGGQPVLTAGASLVSLQLRLGDNQHLFPHFWV